MTVTILAAALLCATTTQDGGAAPESHRRMVETLARLGLEAARSNPFFGRDPLDAATSQLASLSADAPPKMRWRLLRTVAFHQLRLGLTEEAVASYEASERVAAENSKSLKPEELLGTWFDLGLAYLRLGETSNCVMKHNESSCIFPIEPKGVHVDVRGSRGAIREFTRVLERKPDQWAARWLLNIAYMTLGEYPDKVPPAYLVTLKPFDPGGLSFPRFADVGPKLGVHRPETLAGGAVADDFDGDGVLDLATTGWAPYEQVRIRRGHSDGTFEDATEGSGLAGITGGLYMTQADFDNDGDLDLLIPRGAWMRQNGMWPRSLLANDGHGRFVDVAYEVGVAEPMFPSQCVAWSDYDNDGDLDLYVGSEYSEENKAPSLLLRNDAGKFTDVARAAGVTNDAYAKGATWGDYDGDRYPDLYVSNLGGANRLYHNKRDGTFEDVAEKAGVTGPSASFSCWWWDYDNDGALDLFVASYHPVAEPYFAWAASSPIAFEPQALYRGDGKGGFTLVTKAAGLARPACTMGSNFGDFDDDGYLDAYLATGYPGYEALMPNIALWNRGGTSFADVTVPSGMGSLQKGHAVSFLDYDRDGDLDVFESLGGAFPGDGYADAMYQNPGFGNHWIEVRLEGVRSNRCAIGAHIRADITEEGRKRSIHRWVGCGSSFGGNPMQQHLGLGKASKVDQLVIEWPTSDTRQTFTDVPAGKRLRIREGANEFAAD